MSWHAEGHDRSWKSCRHGRYKGPRAAETRLEERVQDSGRWDAQGIQVRNTCGLETDVDVPRRSRCWLALKWQPWSDGRRPNPGWI